MKAVFASIFETLALFQEALLRCKLPKAASGAQALAGCLKLREIGCTPTYLSWLFPMYLPNTALGDAILNERRKQLRSSIHAKVKIRLTVSEYCLYCIWFGSRYWVLYLG